MREKELTRARDELSRQQRALPWEKVEKHYVFEGPHGQVTLADLFQGRSQLVLQHFMFAPGWKEGCIGCSMHADHVDGPRMHMEQHDVSYAAVSRAPYAELAPFKERMGWGFQWVSSDGSDFNYDYNVSFTKEEEAAGQVYHNYKLQPFQCEELPGISLFYKDASGDIFHTYSMYGRGSEQLGGIYGYFDLLPKGRNEHGKTGTLMDWAQLHDRYGQKISGSCHGAESKA